MSFAPKSFTYEKYIFQFLKNEELILRVSNRKIRKCTYRMFLSISGQDDEQYLFLENFPNNDEFKVYFNINYLQNTNFALHEVRTSIITNKDDVYCLSHLYFVEETPFLEPFKDTSNFQQKILSNASYDISAFLTFKHPAGDARIPFNATAMINLSHHILSPSYPIYQIMMRITPITKRSVPKSMIAQMCMKSLETIIQKNMESVVNSDIRFSKLFFIDKIDSLNYHVRLYMYPKILRGTDFLFYDPRTPVINSLSSSYEIPTDGNLVSFLLNASYAPMKKLSIPIQIHKIYNEFHGDFQPLSIIETKVVYRELIFDRKITLYDEYYFGKNKNQSQRIYFSNYRTLIYENAKKRYDDIGYHFKVFRKNIFQRWKDVEIDFVADGPFKLDELNGIECFQSMVDDSPILSYYSWLIVSSYVYSKTNTMRFVAVAIPKDVVKQKFKDLTIGEGGITPFWIKS